MQKGGRALAPSQVRPLPRIWWIAVLGAWALGLLLPSCQKDDLLKPGEVPIDVMTATFVPDSVFNLNPIELNGEVLEREWGGPLDQDLPFFQIRMSRENGGGDVGAPVYVSAKAVYTESDIYFLFRWVDDDANQMKDALFYTGPNPRGCDPNLVDPANWSFVDPDNPSQVFDEDRLSVAFEIEPTGDALGAFDTQGCQVACHTDQNPAFGAPGYGLLDVWTWLATRTNVVRDLYNDQENPDFPPRGVPGYLEDYVADPVSGLAPDPGTPPWRLNFEPGSAVPLWVYRPGDDPFVDPFDPQNCFNAFGERCLPNNGLPTYYIWRETLQFPIDHFASCDSINNAVLPSGTESRPWRAGDAVSGYIYTYPSGSRADVKGKAKFDTGLWTLEIGRPLRTGDPAHDVVFSGVEGDEVAFAVALFDNSGTVHWGSGPQRLKFGSKAVFTQRRRTAPAEGP
jgi:hypothetical protein